RRLWLVVAGTTLLAFAGSFVVSTLTARDYLEQQLYVQSKDNAAALALTMSQQAPDPAMRELLLTALFDSGHFREARFTDIHGKVEVERKNEARIDNVPGWFTSVFPLHARPGEALVSNGWQQAGRVTLVADTRFAYGALWRGALQLLAWITIAGVVTGLLGMLLLRAIRAPLDRVVEQAEAISERRFLTVELPHIPELRTMVAALNSMVERVRAMFAEEAARIQALQLQANGDALTGLANRGWFDSRLAAALAEEDAAADGCVLWLQLHDLHRLNATLGHEGCDQLLQEVADLWRDPLSGHHDWLAARANGGDFLLLAPRLDGASARIFGEGLMARLIARLDSKHGLSGNVAHLGIATYRHGQDAERVRRQATDALQAALDAGDNAVVLESTPDADVAPPDWPSLLTRGLSERCFYLQAFPVVASNGSLLHEEMALRLRHPDSSAPLPAGAFMPSAIRHGLSSALDLEAAHQAVARIRATGRPVALNLSIESVQSADFLDQLVKELKAFPDETGKLWLEISEHGLRGELQTLRRFTSALRPLGCHVGIDHFGRHLSSLPWLHELGLDYLKIDSSLVDGLESHPGNQALVRAIASVAQALGLMTIAEHVRTPGERELLARLGVSGLTGPVLN
ncbi:MAG TPA: EAL domain-containing protein, partial [Moraxellaceae bacterium]|nr:EAL domain-containing protein [Moraxellaceae bacterium]